MSPEAFTLVVQCGAAGTDAAPDNPLGRATRLLLEDGHRFVSAIPAVFTAVDGTAFWLGYFVLTEPGRILFFPGGGTPSQRVVGGLWDGRSRFDLEFDVDHLTLEQDRKTWHMTDRRGRHQGGGRTRDVGGRILWFCVTASGSSDFRPLRQGTIVTYEPVSNAEEAQARVDRFFACVSNGASSPIALPAKPPDDRVLHFAVLVSPPGAPVWNGDGMTFPYAPLGIERMSLKGTIANASSLLLSQEIEIQILALWVPGRASPGPLTFTYPWSTAEPFED